MTSPAPPAAGRAWRAWARACSQPRSARNRSESLASASKRCNSCGDSPLSWKEVVMRAIWKGAVSFGLVSIAVKLFSATEEKDIRFHQVHREDGGRIKYKRVCAVDGEEVSYGDIAKGYDLGGGDMVILTDEDLSGLPLTTSRTIDVLQFLPLEQSDQI